MILSSVLVLSSVLASTTLPDPAIVASPSPASTNTASTLVSQFNTRSGSTIEVQTQPTTTGIALVQADRVGASLMWRPIAPQFDSTSAELATTIVAFDAIVPIINDATNVASLSTQQLAGIYTGTITNWKQVGGQDSPITLAILRDGGEGVEFMTRAFVFGTATPDPTSSKPASSAVRLGSTLDIEAVVQTTPGAIGFTTYSNAMASAAAGFAPLAINGVYPSTTSIADGSYPFATPVFVAHAGNEGSDTTAFTGWLTSDAGQAFLPTVNLVPLANAAGGFNNFKYFGQTTLITNYQQLREQFNNAEAGATTQAVEVSN